MVFPPAPQYSHLVRLAARTSVRILGLLAGLNCAHAAFTDVTQSAGISFLHGTLNAPAPSSPLYYAGGLAITDLNKDGWLDFYATRLDGGNLMFINNGDGTFRDEAAARGLSGPLNSNGAVFADIDNDGDADLLLTAIHSPRYYTFINQGDGTFSKQFNGVMSSHVYNTLGLDEGALS